MHACMHGHMKSMYLAWIIDYSYYELLLFGSSICLSFVTAATYRVCVGHYRWQMRARNGYNRSRLL
jgi:hypothetical protein